MSGRWELVGKATEFISEEMGVALRRSALSPNIRERMDHSCAILSGKGRIVAQAEHIPVHLGSFKVGTENLLARLARDSTSLAEGDMVVVNDPYISGTHLNDVMLLAPVFVQRRIAAYVVTKAHIVDVGGPAPGSLNPEARTLFGEGLVIPPTKLLRAGVVVPEVLRWMAANFKDAPTAIGDIHAEIAANRMGIARLARLFQRFGPRSVQQSWEESIAHTRRVVQRGLAQWRAGRYRSADYVEWAGSLLPIQLTLSISGRAIVADFTGSHPQVEAPINAVLGVTYSATAFAVRCALGSTVATNAGFYDCVNVRAPEGCLVNPMSPAAVSGGNVETTQRVADVVFRALSQALPERIPAASAGTMMNVMLGGHRSSGSYWAYYETIGGGTGGRPEGDGVSAVQTNMTNTLNTPIEIAEMEYPLFFTRYAIRSHSGGRGEHAGGDGIVRSFRVRRPTTLSVLSDRFLRGPWGLQGGSPGSPGRVTVVRKSGRTSMPSKFVTDLATGDEVILETPGGGGFGKARRRGASRSPLAGNPGPRDSRQSERREKRGKFAGDYPLRH
jgi:N-methylhydantoinase B